MEKAKMKDEEIVDYQFLDLKGVPLNESTSNYEFVDINSISPTQEKEHQEIIRNERAHATRSNFKVAPIVKEHRGMIKQEENERENQIQNEVSRRLLMIEEDAYERGFQRGQEDGREEVFRETQAATDEKLELLNSMIKEILSAKAEMLKEERIQVYETVKTLSKWIVLRELKEDGTYIERLLEKLILEMQTKSNLLIHVNQSSFESMPEVLEQVQKRIGELTNVRVEVDHNQDVPGMVLQSENGILNGRLGVQFKNLDKLFSNVGLPFEDSEELNLSVEEPVQAAPEAEESLAQPTVDDFDIDDLGSDDDEENNG
ncbi:MAG: flagellar assembly protein FliH [Bacteriovoracaceae bacterium]|jgi:flagellar assembly protein FliH